MRISDWSSDVCSSDLNNVVLCDSKGVIYKGRTEGMNQWKSAHAAETTDRTLADAMRGADVFFGLTVAGAVTQDMVKSIADKPNIFAMADRKSTRLNSRHSFAHRMPSSA